MPTLAPRVTLGPFGHEWQTWNNCGPAALAIGLSYFGVERTQADIATVLRSEPADKNVSLDELLGYAATTGVLSRLRLNGTVDLLRKLNNAGIPLLTEGWLRVGEDIGHYRIVRGYDPDTGQLLTQDSFHGPNLWVDDEEFAAMWRPFFLAYAPLYRAEQEPLVTALPGADWKHEAMSAGALDGGSEQPGRTARRARACLRRHRSERGFCRGLPAGGALPGQPGGHTGHSGRVIVADANDTAGAFHGPDLAGGSGLRYS
jgi:hypothetical protein